MFDIIRRSLQISFTQYCPIPDTAAAKIMESSDKELNPTTTTSYSPFPSLFANGLLHFEVKKHSKLKRLVLRARKELEVIDISYGESSD